MHTVWKIVELAHTVASQVWTWNHILEPNKPRTHVFDPHGVLTVPEGQNDLTDQSHSLRRDLICGS